MIQHEEQKAKYDILFFFLAAIPHHVSLKRSWNLLDFAIKKDVTQDMCSQHVRREDANISQGSLKVSLLRFYTSNSL